MENLQKLKKKEEFLLKQNNTKNLYLKKKSLILQKSNLNFSKKLKSIFPPNIRSNILVSDPITDYVNYNQLKFNIFFNQNKNSTPVLICEMIFEADPTSNIISNLFNERYFYNLKKLTLKLLKTNFKYQSEYFPYIILGKIFESISKKEIKLIQIINKEYERIIKNYHKNYKKITYINDIIVNNVDDCFKLVINKILKDFKTKDFILPTNKTDKNNFNFVGKNISNITKISFIKKDMYKIFLGNNSSLDINLNKNFQINYLIYEIIRQRPFPEWYYLFKN